jgi:hypothetical protein
VHEHTQAAESTLASKSSLVSCTRPEEPEASVPYQIFVSAANSLYMAWQTQLFCYSAWKTCHQRPVITLHSSGEPMRVEFRQLQCLGFTIVDAPSYSLTKTNGQYPPRNEVGSLIEIARQLAPQGPILFCEPDMLFVRPCPYKGALAAEFYGYLRYDEPRVVRVLQKYGFTHRLSALNNTRRIGVPYFLPLSHIQRLGARWLEVLDQFDELHWIDIMYAFGIAVDMECLDVEVTHIMTDNYRPMRPLRHMIHYGYTSEVWDKRSYRTTSPLDLCREALTLGRPGTVLGEIMEQIRGAREFFAHLPS